MNIKKIIIYILLIIPMILPKNYIDYFTNISLICQIIYDIYKFIFVILFIKTISNIKKDRDD